jgi:hypothetical protein
MSNDIKTLAREAYEALMTLESHVAPADKTGQRVHYEAKERLKALAHAAEELSSGVQPA